MKRLAIILSLLSCLAPAAALGQSVLDFQLNNRARDFTAYEDRDLLRYGAASPALYYNLSPSVPVPDGSMFLAMHTAQFLGIRRVELNRMQTTLKGAEVAASSAFFLGAVGNSLGLWEEKATWWMVGGAALLGALYGGTGGYEDPNWRYEFRWEEEHERYIYGPDH